MKASTILEAAGTIIGLLLVLALAAGLVSLCTGGDAEARGRKLPANSAFPDDACPELLPLAADEYLAIEYSYEEEAGRLVYRVVPPNWCGYTAPSTWPTLRARCVVIRRERLAPDERLRVTGWVRPIRGPALPAFCAAPPA